MISKPFGVTWFAGQMHIHIRHTDKDLASQVTQYCKRNNVRYTVYVTKKGYEIFEIIGDEYILNQLRKLTIKKQIVRLVQKLVVIERNLA